MSCYNSDMPDYTTVGKVYDLYPRIGSMTTITSANIAYYIDQAENEMNGFIANNYTLPFSATVPIIETIATEFSVVKILERFFTQEIGSKNEWVEARYEHIFARLSQISSGTLALMTSSYEVLNFSAEGGIYSNNKDYLPTFNNLNDTIQQVDGDLLDKEYNDVSQETYRPDLE